LYTRLDAGYCAISFLSQRVAIARALDCPVSDLLEEEKKVA